MNIWIGRWLIAVAVVHTAFAIVVFKDVLLAVLQRGVFNSVGSDPMTAAVVWFVLFGIALFICGIAVHALERSAAPVPKSLAWSLLAMTLLGVVLMPSSGFWLAFPPAIALLLRRQHGQTAPARS